MIKGVTIHPLKQIEVPKGNIFHVLKRTDKGFFGFGEAYFSQIKQGAIKGWKRHNRMVLNLIVPIGTIKFIIFDDRDDSPTKGNFQEVVVSPKTNYVRLTIEPGLWMAFAGVDKDISLLLDIIPEPHDPAEADSKDLDEIPYNFDV